MKRIYLLLTLMLSLLGSNKAMAIEQPSGLMSLGDSVATVETGKWYFLFNTQSERFVKESNNALTQTVTPNGKSVEGNEGYLITLEDAGDGRYYIRTANNNYFCKPTSSAVATSSTKTANDVFTLVTVSGSNTVYGLQGTDATYKYLSAPSGGGNLKGGTVVPKDKKSTGWKFFTADFQSTEELTGRDLYNYQMSKLGLIRLHNKRTATSYLTTNTAGSAVGSTKAATGLTQIWILEKSGVGYTLRSAKTGQFLQDNFAAPANGSNQLYIQFSPNNTGTEAYINVSSTQDFSGQTCMNLGTNGTQITKWSYAGDAGSDWAIELVSDVTEDDVRANLNSVNGYVAELKDGAYYRIQSVAYSLYATDVETDLKSIKKDDANYAQYWKLTKNGNGWVFQNVLTKNYIQPQNSTSAIYRVAALTATLYPARTSDKWLYQWTIANASGGSDGMHTSSSQGNNVVKWSTNADASIWAFQEVQLTEEEIEAARGSRKEYDDLVANLTTIKSHLANLFADDACTTLKDEIQALSDDQLAANADYAGLNDALKAMVLKIKNDTWQQFTNTSTGYSAGYEKFFRIADYKVYSNYTEMCNDNNFKMSNSFGRLSGPTGIYANSGDIVYIFVDKDPENECQLRVEMVSTDGVAGNHSTGTQSALQKGLNVFCPSQQVIIYIFHQLNNTKKYLADYPDIKVHIEGGRLNGYWDATRGMTNADWALLQQDLLTAPYVNLKTNHLVFQMDRDLVLEAEPKEMEGLMYIWETICANEDRYMGVEDFEGRYNNIWNVFSGASSYMHASTYGTWYTESTISTVMNYETMRKPGSIWGPSHEIGHNHQASINVVGTTESSNNLFSNINRYEQGIQTSRRQLPPDVFDALAKGTPWVGRNIWNTTSMYYQLYLYFHAQKHDEQFYPNLFRALRKNPITKVSGYDSTTEYTYEKDGETKTGVGANITYGKYDYLHLAKTICDVAQADLSEFFEAYGMFVPVDKYFVGDYANYLVTTTQADIDAAKKYMQKYEKKLGNLMFIDDHVVAKPAVADNPFLGKPSGTNKVNDTGQHTELGNGLPIGDSGDYEEYDGRTEYATNNDYCTLSSSTLTFKGTGYLGHKFYDQNGNLVWATNAKSITIPTRVKTLGLENLTIVAAEPNMTDVPCPYYKSGTLQVYGAQMYFGNEEQTKKWWLNKNVELDKYLPENTIGSITSKNPTEEITSMTNIINAGTAKSIVINGDLPAYIPEETVAEQVKFTKTIDGYAALDLPFAVTNTDMPGLKVAFVDNGNLNFAEAEKAEAGQPVVVNGNVDLTLANATLKSASYQEQENVNILAADGNSIVKAEKAAPFLFNMDQATAIDALQIKSEELRIKNGIFNLAGQRVNKPSKGVYIMSGKKVVVK